MKRPAAICAAAALITCIGAAITASPRRHAADGDQYLITPEQKIRMAERIIEAYYVDTVDAEKAVEAGIVAMLKTLDPHSTYTNAEETKELTEPLNGTFSGVGISFNMLDDTLYVVSTILGGPCEKVGILAGDRIIEANDTLLSGARRSTSDVRNTLRGPKGTTVRMKVKRGTSPQLIDFKVVRDEIPIYSVDAAYMAAPGTGYLRLTRFAETTTDEVRSALRKLSKEGMKRLVIDLQSNGGGYMLPAVDIADMFLAAGDTIVYTRGVHTPASYYVATGIGPYRDVEVVVLVDQYSASASEILSGAMQDNDRGVLIGRRTFGKGLVQRPFPFPDGSMIRLTTSRYYTPSGRSIQRPYTDGGDDSYYTDISDRLRSGELTDAEHQVHGPDSLRHYTRLGRVVYGGGGVNPDIYVPLDTAYYTPLYRDLVAKGIINRYTLQYVDRHREDLKRNYPDEDDFLSRFTVDARMLDDLRTLAEADSVTFEPEQMQRSRDYIAGVIKGLIGRDLFDAATYYKATNELNPLYRRALQHFADPAEHRRTLTPPL